MIIYLCMKYESNTPLYSIYRPETNFRTYGTGRTDKGDAICPPPITNGGGIMSHKCVIRGKSKHHLLRSAVAGRLYKHHSKLTSNSGFDRSFMPCSSYILFAAEQRVGYQISWVDLQREVNCS